jgi:hypothetical protein
VNALRNLGKKFRFVRPAPQQKQHFSKTPLTIPAVAAAPRLGNLTSANDRPRDWMQGKIVADGRPYARSKWRDKRRRAM